METTGCVCTRNLHAIHISMRVHIPLCTAVSPYKLVRRAIVYPQVRAMCCLLRMVATLNGHCFHIVLYTEVTCVHRYLFRITYCNSMKSECQLAILQTVRLIK